MTDKMKLVLQALRDAGYASGTAHLPLTKKDDRLTFRAQRIQEMVWWTFSVSTATGHEATTVVREEKLDTKNIAYYETMLKAALHILESP